jgi:hypothetical protein
MPVARGQPPLSARRSWQRKNVNLHNLISAEDFQALLYANHHRARAVFLRTDAPRTTRAAVAIAKRSQDLLLKL